MDQYVIIASVAAISVHSSRIKLITVVKFLNNSVIKFSLENFAMSRLLIINPRDSNCYITSQMQLLPSCSLDW